LQALIRRHLQSLFQKLALAASAPQGRQIVGSSGIVVHPKRSTALIYREAV
jgi:hypothetical protein